MSKKNDEKAVLFEGKGFRFFIFIAVFLLCVVFLCCYYLYVNSGDEEEIVEKLPFIDCSLTESTPEGIKKCLDAQNCSLVEDKCYYSKAMFYVDRKRCIEIEDEELLAMCYLNVDRTEKLEAAVLNDDVSLCDEFETSESVEFCYDNYYIAKRFNENDVEFCLQIKDEDIKNECEK